MEELETLKKADEEKLKLLEQEQLSQEMPAAENLFIEFLGSIKKMADDGLCADIKSRIIQMLVQKVEITAESFRLHFHIGETHINRGSRKRAPIP